MAFQTTREQIIECITPILGLSSSALNQLNGGESLQPYGLDSLNFIRLIVILERRFGITFQDDELDFTAFGSIEAIQKRIDIHRTTQQSFHQAKCLVVDCDGVLWQGIIDEVGIKGVSFNSFNLELHRLLIELYNKGVFLCIASKNSEECIVGALKSRSDEIALRQENFCIIESNYFEKYKSIVNISKK